MAERKISVALEGRMDNLSQTLQQAERETEKHTRAMRESFRIADGGIMSVGKSLETLKGAVSALALGAFLQETTQAANQLERANVGLAVTARYVGAGMEVASLAAQSLSKDGLMSVAETSKGLQNLLSRGFSLEESVRLMNAFKDSAAFNRQASLGFGEAVVTATEGLKNENSILVDNAGVTKNVSVMWKEYALQHGTTVEKLTQSQKRIAELNGVLKETEGQAGNAARMTESFAGAQAKAAQQSFELKASLGVAMQPALQGVLTILSPVVSGLRDMVYWVETLGARAGGTYDKLKIRIEERFRVPNTGEATGIRERDARIAARLAEVDKNVDSTIADIVKRSMGPTLPDIGKDSGIRRKDTILPEKDKKAESLAEGWKREIISVKALTAEAAESFSPWDKAIEEANRKADLLLQKFGKVPGAKAAIEEMRAALIAKPGRDAARDEALDVMNSDAYLNYQGKLSDKQQKTFDNSAMLANWAAQRADYNRQEEQAQFDHIMAMQGFEEAANQAKLLYVGNAHDAVISQFNFEQQQAEMQLQWKLEHTALEESQIARLKSEAAARVLAAERKLGEDLARADKQAFDTKAGYAQQSIGILQMFGNKNKAIALTSIALQKGLNMTTTFMAAQTGSMLAYSSQLIPGDPTSILRAEAARDYTLAQGYITMALIGAQGLAEMVTSAGGGSSGSYGGGVPGSPVVTQPDYSKATHQQGNVTVNVLGTIIGEDKWVEESLFPLINAALGRNVTLNIKP